MAKRRTQRVATVGVAEHGNSAVLVTIAPGGELLDRRRIDLTEPGTPTHPHHHEGSWAVGRYLDTPWARASVAPRCCTLGRETHRGKTSDGFEPSVLDMTIARLPSRFSLAGASVVGPSHARVGRNNQDAWSAWSRQHMGRHAAFARALFDGLAREVQALATALAPEPSQFSTVVADLLLTTVLVALVDDASASVFGIGDGLVLVKGSARRPAHTRRSQV